MRTSLLCLVAGLAALGLPTAAAAQSAGASSVTASAALGPARSAAQSAADAPAPSPSVPADTVVPKSPGSAAGRLVRDVAGDYKHFFMKETAFWYGGGAAAAGLVHLADEAIRDAGQDASQSVVNAFKGGEVYGGPVVQYSMAAGWWIIGQAAGNSRGAQAGRDLVRAQISTTTWTYALKLATHRTRPNGDPRSFPSGHASSTFATAMVLQRHYGWKLGVPMFAAASYTMVSRVTDNKHWASDLVMGAAVGMASARTVTLHVGNSRFSMAPLAVPRGAGVAFTLVN